MRKQSIKKIFIVDDDPFWTELLSQMLQDLGYTNILKFKSGADCLKNMHLTPSLIFLDYQMEEMNGLEVLQKINEHARGTGVVFCSANDNIRVALTAMKNGSFDYLLKSKCGLNELAIVINEMGGQQMFAEKVF
jgi:DNA-binding NtrC family response regulator